jgi:hypothetical protein
MAEGSASVPDALDVRVRRLALVIGVDIRGVDLSRPLPADVLDALREALIDRQGQA